MSPGKSKLYFDSWLRYHEPKSSARDVASFCDHAGLLGAVCWRLFSVIGPGLTLSAATLIAGGSKGNVGESLMRPKCRS